MGLRPKPRAETPTPRCVSCAMPRPFELFSLARCVILKWLMRVSSLPKVAAKLLGQRKRRSWIGTERAHVEFRDVPAEELERFTRHVRDAVGKLEHARWVEVNPHTRRVVVAFRESAYSLAALERVVEEAERAARIEQADFGDDRREHPADTEPEERLLVELAGDLTGFLVGGALRWSLFKPSSMAHNATALMSVLRASPRLRRSLDERLGPRRAELVLNLSLAFTQGFAQRPVSSLVDMMHKRSLLGEVRARRQAWEQREAELCAEPVEHHATDTRSDPRPVPLPRGPIEEYADRAWIVSLGGFAVSFLTTRSFQRAVAALFGALPKPARYGRDVFASELGRELAERGVLVLDQDVLRKLDRIDCLVLQGDLVARDLFRVGEVATTGAVSEAHARELTERLFDADDPIAVKRYDDFSLGPARRLSAELGPELAAHVKDLGRRGALVLGLARAGVAVAVVEVQVVPRTGIAELIASARAAQMRVVVATGDENVLHGLSADDVIGDSEGLASGIRRLQREGRGVCLVATGSSRALPSADCGIGLMRAGEPAPWGAHMICGEDLSDVRFVLEACVSARKIAKQSVNIALGAATLGAIVSAGGLLPMTTRRVIAVVNAATLLSMSNGLRSSAALARRALPAPRDRTPWHALDAEGVLERLGSSSEHGLSRRVALERGEPRAAEKSSLVELSDAVTDELFNPLAPLLAAGAGVSAVVGSVADASMVGGVVVLNAVIGGVQRFRTERAIRELSRTAKRRAVVRRNGQLSEVDGGELVPGDVVLLGPGDVVPADCRVVEAESLEVDASSLTGESLPVPKSAAPSFETEVADRRSMLYEGTSIAAGRATAVVVAVGEETEARRGASKSGPNPVTSGVEQRLRSLIDLTAPVALGAGVGLVGAGLLRGRRLEELVGAGVSLAVAAVPEGLPLLATAAQLASAERLSRRGALVRNARSIEALGRVDVLCVDKTGTVTEGRLELSHVSDGSVEQPAAELGQELCGVLAAAVRATPDPHGPGRADPTDAALLRAAEHLAVGGRRDAEGWTRGSELSFEAGRSYHAVLGLLAGGSRLSVKGAPEAILPECTHWQRGEQSTDLDGELRRMLGARAERLARRGLRVLCVAERSAGADESLDPSRLAGLTFRGFLAFSDPVRPSAARALERLARAGVETLMVTGDHPSTAEAIATDLGLLGGKRVLTGAELAQLSDEELDQKLDGVSVFARVTPAQKVRVVRALQRAGRVVAMVGDGANDAPAIRLANVGVAIGEHSTAAARGAADVVLTDERIETLVDAISEGRAMWASVRDAVSILVGGNLGEIGFTLAAGLVDGRSPLNPRQLLLVNLLTDVAPAMAIALRPPSAATLESLASEGPDASLGKPLNRDIAARAVVTALGAGSAWAVARLTGSAERARTVGLLALVGTQLGQTVWSGGLSRPVLTTSLASTAVLAGIVQTPGLSHFFGCRPVGPVGWAIAVGASAAATGAAAGLPRLGERVLVRLRREKDLPDAGAPSSSPKLPDGNGAA
jgi:cation-transporting P-type ATPase I